MALTLREVCGLTTEEIAQAFLTPAPTLAQRIVRAKAKIRDARIPYQVPARGRAAASGWTRVLRVIYLVFNEGYAASSGASLTRHDLSGEAIRLGRLLRRVAAGAGGARAAGADAAARIAARRAHVADGRTDPARRSGSLAVEPRSDRGGIGAGGAGARRRGGSARTRFRRRSRRCTPRRRAPPRPTGREIVGLYDVLLRADPSPVIELNRAVAVAMRDGPAAGLALIDAILERGDLADYHLAHAARADLCRRLGRTADARALVRARARADAAGAGAAVSRAAACRARREPAASHGVDSESPNDYAARRIV